MLPARLRASQPQDADLARLRPERRGDRGRAADRHRLVRLTRSLARRPVQLRRPPHLHGRAGRGDQAPLQRARSRAPVPRARSTSGSAALPVPSPRSSASPLTLAIWIGRDGHPLERADRRPGLARARRGRVRARAAQPRVGGDREGRGAGGRPRRAARRGRVPPHPRPDEARPDRRGGARDGDQAGGGAVREADGAARDQGAPRPAARRAARRRGGASGGVARGSDRDRRRARRDGRGRVVRARALGAAIVDEAKGARPT